MFSLSSDWVISVILPSSSLILFSILFCHQVHLLSFLLWLLYLLVYYISLYLLFLYWCFLFFFFFNYFNKYVHSCLLRHFCHCWFKINVTPLSSRCWHLWIVFFYSIWNLPGSWYNQCLLKLDFFFKSFFFFFNLF